MAFRDSVVSFSCSGTGTLFMRINGTSENHLSSSLRNDMDLNIYPPGFCTHKITFIAKAKFNNTLIQCEALEFSVGGVNVTLIVQGK